MMAETTPIEELLLFIMRSDVFKIVTNDFFRQFIGMFSKSLKVRNSLMSLIELLVNELKTSKQHDWKKHTTMCWLLGEIIHFGENCVIKENAAKIFEYIGTVVDMGEDEFIVRFTIKIFVAFPSSKVQFWLMERLDCLMTQLGGEVLNWREHKNLSEIIWRMLRSVAGDFWAKSKKYYSNVLNQQVSDQIVDYMKRLIDFDETKVMAIVILEMICVKSRLDKDGQDRLRLKLSYLTEKIEPGARLSNRQFNSVNYQVAWCSRWCLQNVLDGERRVDQVPMIKLSPDLFEARNDSIYLPAVRCPFGVTSGVFYYEVALITPGWILIGWSTRDATLGYWDRHQKVGNNENSISLDVHHRNIVHNNIEHPIFNPPPSQSPNIVGCLIDTHKRQFVFYLNGHQIDCPINAHFSTSPYYATVSLFENQQCRFNFGQEQFKYPPQEIHFKNFDEVTNGDLRKFQLIDTEEREYLNWFKHPIVDNQVDLLHRDAKQNEHDDFVRQQEHHFTKKEIDNIDLTRIFDCNRFIQSVIEVMQTELPDDEYIRVIMTKELCLLKDMEIYHFTNKMYELIYPYTQLQFNTESNTKCHNLGIILITILNHFPRIPLVIYQMSLNFLLSTKLISIETLRKNSQFVNRALSGFDLFRLDEHAKRMLQNNQTFILTMKSIEQYGQVYSISSLYESNCDSQALQASICAKWLYDQVFSSSNDSQVRGATLNPTDRSVLLKLSSDRLSARSDCHWQSVRSIDHVPSDLYYFEVILLTDGPMRIGWATRRTDLNESQIGKDHLSISFDGFTRAVPHQGEVYQVEDIEQWKAEDVIGCAIDKTNGQFAFYLNGKQLSLPAQLQFSTLPYHAAVSLYPHQQVYFNFGQAPFKYGPQQIDYWDFQLALSYRDTKSFNSLIDFRNAKLTNAMISVDSTVNTKNISFQSPSLNFYPNKRIKPNSGLTPQLQLASIAPSIPRPRAECRLCTETSTTKLLRFACCPDLILCLDCAKNRSFCPKCSKHLFNRQTTPQNSTSSVSECRLCLEQIQTRVIKFLCCGTSLCLDCIKPIVKCAKCTKK